MNPATPDLFRHLLGHFASGVTVVTALDPGDRPNGMTATALAAVSLTPPLLLLCVNHRDPFHDVLGGTVTFAINVLADDQESVSEQFASESAGRFQNVGYQPGPSGVPLLDGVVAQIVCERWNTIRAGDHTVFIGLVVGGAVFHRPPLLHFQGCYSSLQDRGGR